MLVIGLGYSAILCIFRGLFHIGSMLVIASNSMNLLVYKSGLL